MQTASISRPLKYISLIFSTIIGIIFIVSGFLKAVDPWGTAIKFEEYFAIYGFDSLMSLADALAIWLCGAEMMMGFMMLFKVRLRLISIFALASMVIFTIISLLSVTIFPVDDCGCFGDAIHLTPMQTLYKNLIVLPMVITIWYRYRPDRVFAFKFREVVFTVIFCIGAMGFSIYNYIHLPAIDFLPYRVGVDMMAEAAPQQLEFVLIYRNIESGELREFSIADTEWRDASKWEWVETREVGNNASARHTLDVSDFVLRDSSGTDITKRILSAKGVINLVCITNFNRIRKPCLERLSSFVHERMSHSQRVVIVSPSSYEKPYYEFEEGDKVSIFNIDDIVLKALLRANNGAVILRDGVIESKYSCADL